MMALQKNYIDKLIDEARIQAEKQNLKQKKKASEDADNLLRMLDKMYKKKKSKKHDR